MAGSRRDNVQEDVYGKRRKGRFRDNLAMNDEYVLRSMYERILSELAMNRFRWTGFPGAIDHRFLEYQLHSNGLIVVFRDTGTKNRPGTDGIFALRGTPSGQRDMQDNPAAFTLSGPGMEQHFQGLQLSAKRCVPIWPNYTRQTDWDIISIYARKLAKADMTIEINLNSARRNKVLVYDENMRLSAENINRQIDRGDPTIAVKYDISQMVTALDLGVDPKSIETLSVIRGRLWSEAMGLLGINNSNQDKKERLVEAEVSGNDDQVDNMRFVNLNARRQACLKMQKMFPRELSEVWVEYQSDHLEKMKAQFEESLGVEGSNA